MKIAVERKGEDWVSFGHPIVYKLVILETPMARGADAYIGFFDGRDRYIVFEEKGIGFVPIEKMRRWKYLKDATITIEV